MHTKPVTPSSFAETTVEEPIEPSRGTLIDRFLVLEQLGAGGMGVVYAAHDPELDRKVALKLLLPRVSAAGYGDQTRLLREAQALAKLSHPNVVAVHDVGTRGDRVWIAMEFVSGQTLTAWARERPRRWPELLAVLADVARGMAAAHEAGLVHRDIKPDNVMIGQDGRVRVMDFGLAHGRATGSTEPDLTATLESGHLTAPLALRLTAQGAVQGTPAYMAPEQWLGHDEQPATDQFGWSVMAWELLYGERPFAGATNIAIATAVLAGQRRPPPRGRSVPSWLRRVLERGLATDPTKRWPSMATLLSALDHGKTRARIRLAATAMAVIAVIAAGTVAYRRWDLAQRVATCEAAGAVIDQTWNDDARQRLRDAFRATGVSYAATSAEKTIPWLDKRATEWKRARTDICLNATVRGTWNADLWDRATWCIDDRQMEFESLIKEISRADASVVQKAVGTAAGLRTAKTCLGESLLLHRPRPPAQEREAIRSVHRMLAESTAIAFAGKYKEALSLAVHARGRAGALNWPSLLAEAQTVESRHLRRMGMYAEAAIIGTQAYFTAAHAASWDVAADASIDLIYTTGYLLKRSIEAQSWAEHARVALAHAGDQVDMHEASRLGNLAIVHHIAGEHTHARPLFEQVLETYEQEFGRNHPSLGGAMISLANSYTTTGNYLEARTLYERALELQQRELGPDHPAFATNLGQLANLYRMEGDFDTSRYLSEQALDIETQAFGLEHPRTAHALHNLATSASDVGLRAEARVLYEHSLEIMTRTLGPEHLDVAESLNDYASLFILEGRYADARILLERSLGVLRKTLDSDHPHVAMTLGNIASCYLEEQRPEDALPLLNLARNIYNAHEGEQPGELMVSFDYARATLATGGDPAAAIAEALRVREKVSEDDPNTVNLLADIEEWLGEHHRSPRGELGRSECK